MKLAPSKNPEKESKQFGIASLILGISSLLIWFLGIAGLALGARGIILSKRVNNTRYFVFSIVGMALGLVALVYHYLQ